MTVVSRWMEPMEEVPLIGQADWIFRGVVAADAATDGAWSVSAVSRAKTDEPIEMPFGLVGAKEPCTSWGHGPYGIGMGHFGGGGALGMPRLSRSWYSQTSKFSQVLPLVSYQ